MTENNDTLLMPGEKYRPDATFDKTLRLAWSKLRDEETRRVEDTYAWEEPNTIVSDASMRAVAERRGAPEEPMYLADGTNWIRDVTRQSYLDYNGEYQGHRVNQVPFLREWQPFVARSAHEFDWTMSAHSMEDLTDNEKWTVKNQMYGLISAPWILMEFLKLIDPTEILAGDFLWKTYQAEVETVLKGLCHECEDIATFARRFAHEANLELFRGALISGKIHESNRDVTPWGLGDIVTEIVVPIGTTPTAEQITEFHDANYEQYMMALKFYDTAVGSSERPHSHT